MSEHFYVHELSGVDSGTLRLLAAQYPEHYPFLLSSAETVAANDLLLLASNDQLTLRYDGDGLSLVGMGEAEQFAEHTNDFRSALDDWYAANSVAEDPSAPPFIGGWFIYLGYEFAAQLEPSLTLQFEKSQPVAMAQRARAAVVLSHAATPRAVLICEQPDATLRDQILSHVALLQDQRLATSPITAASIDVTAGDQFMRCVELAQQAISDGEVYQANLSRQWRASVTGLVPGDLFEALCNTNPSPFAAYARLGKTTVLSSSPERLVSVKQRVVSTRPIAGTRHRSADPDEDRRLVDELLEHPKERAEHVMLIDLERNDLGRICVPGSVEVDEYMTVESYKHVHHIVSNVTGELQPDTTPGDVIAAVFPGGTITGCPKIRCMQLIADLEGRPRGAYTGSLGYLGRDGQMDLNILIRTFAVTDDSLQFSAGAGIVADSIPAAELDETTAKAKGLLHALEQVMACSG